MSQHSLKITCAGEDTVLVTLEMCVLSSQCGSSRSKDDPLVKEGFTASSRISYGATLEGFDAAPGASCAALITDVQKS